MSSGAEASVNKTMKHSAAEPDATCLVGTKEALETLVTSAKSLASQPSIDRIIQKIDHIQELEDQVRVKDGTIDQLHDEIQQKAADHKTTHERSLAIYDTAREKLKSQLQTSEEQIASMKRETEKRESTYKSITDDHARLVDHAKKLQGHFKTRGDEIKSLKSQIESLEASVKAEKSQNDELGKTLRDREARLSDSQTGLSELRKAHDKLIKQEQYVADQLKDISDLFVSLTDEMPEESMRNFDELWEAACSCVSEAFSEDLPATVLENDQAWEGLRHPLYWKHALPLPRSNSVPAKQMRTVILLTSLARIFDTHIFQPTYLLPHDSGVRILLTSQARKEPQKEAALRAVLQALQPEEQDAVLPRRVDQTCDLLHKVVDHLLPPETFSSFKDKLKSIAEDAAYIWQDMIKSTYAVEPCFDLEMYSDWAWYRLEFQQASPKISHNEGPIRDGDRGLFAIFPQLYVSDVEGRSPETHGVLFMKSQIVAAVEELEHHNPSLELQRTDSVLTKRHRPRLPSGTWPRRGDSVSFLDQDSGNDSPGHAKGD